MVGIICFWDRYATPYLSKYENLFEQLGVKYEVLFWNRLAKPCKTTVTQEEHFVYINKYCKQGKTKIISFIGWRHECIKILKRKKYKYLVLLSTVPAILLEDYVLRYYKDKYVFDIRDYTLEANKLFRKMVMALVKNSCITPISSKGYLRWLEPSDKIMVNHNITIDNSKNFDVPDFSEDKPIKLSFVGNVRLDTQTKAMLITLGKSEKIEQHYFGRILPLCDIEQVTKGHQLTNVVLHGPFNRDDKIDIYRNTDLINTVYVNAEKEEDIPLGDSTPLPNRLYDAIVFYRPLVTSQGTYLAELADQYHLGLNINGFDKNIEQQILDYTRHFNKEEFKDGCNRLRKEVMIEEERFINTITKIFNNWN